jgi:hypothetical protein
MDTEGLRKIWQTELNAQAQGRHLTTSEIYDLLIKENMPDKEVMLAHLSHCSHCSEEFHKMYLTQKKTEFLDIALPQLAGVKSHSPFMKIDTEGGKYTIIIRQSLKEQNKGIITIELAPNLREKAEGERITLKDRQGRILLEGTVVNGQVSQKIEHLDNIDIQRFKIERW